MIKYDFNFNTPEGKRELSAKVKEITKDDNGVFTLHLEGPLELHLRKSSKKKILGMLKLQLEILWQEIKVLFCVLKPGGKYRGLRRIWLPFRLREIGRAITNLLRILITRKWEGRK